MTANEMASEFEIRYDKVTNFAAPGYIDSEISSFLNLAFERFVKQTYNPKTNKLRDGFEGTEKRKKDLSELIRGPRDNSGALVTSISGNQNGVVQYGRFFDLPSDCWLVISEEGLTDYTNCEVPGTNLIIPIKPITHDEYSVNKRNPQKKPYVKGSDGMAWRLDYSRENQYNNPKRHEIVTDGTFNVTEYYIRYIKKLTEIVVDRTTPANQVNCELDETVHNEIVDMAVMIAAGITDPNTYQIKVNEVLNKE